MANCRLAKPYIAVPMLVPGLNYSFETLVESISELGVADQIRCELQSEILKGGFKILVD